MPDCIAPVVDEPITLFGRLISTRGSFAARENKASEEIIIPGAITPPRYSPAALIALKVVAVPKSTTIQGAPYFATAATASTILSAPTSDGLSYKIFRPLSVV